MTALACIGEPISWPRLETLARGGPDDAAAAHLAACRACQRCLDELQADLVALPPLAVPAPSRRRWWRWVAPSMALAAAAAAALVVWRGGEPRASREDVVAVKGLGEVVVDVVRERAGVIRDDVRAFAPGDRWKVVVTCPPAARAEITVRVAEVGTAIVDRPLAPATIACGNRIVLPGAFTLTGTRPNRVCAQVAAPGTAPPGEACVTITPE